MTNICHLRPRCEVMTNIELLFDEHGNFIYAPQKTQFVTDTGTVLEVMTLQRIGTLLFRAERCSERCVYALCLNSTGEVFVVSRSELIAITSET